jgi:DNA polymerase-3 subunit alpha
MTAYFKTYYPLEFMAALLTVFGSNVKKAVPYIAECKRMGFEVLPPDVNKSGYGFVIEGTNLRFGLNSLKGLGEVALERIIEERPFVDLEDAIKRVPKKFLNKRVVDVLSLCGAFDDLANEKNRMKIVEKAYKLRGEKKFDLTSFIENFDQKAKLDHEKAILGVYVSGHPLDGYATAVGPWLEKSEGDRFDTAGIIAEFNVIKTKKGDEMAFVDLDTIEGLQTIVIFPQQYSSIRGQLVEELIMKITVQVEYNAVRGERNYIAKKITIPKKINKGLYIPKAALEEEDTTSEYEQWAQ